MPGAASAFRLSLRGSSVVRLKPSRLKNRSEFLAVRKGVRAGRPLVVVEARRRGDGGPVRLGFTATKKIGNAVIRNRAKRRLRAAAAALIPGLALPASDYVFIARDATASAPWDSLLDDVGKALIRLRTALEGAIRSPETASGAARPDQDGTN